MPADADDRAPVERLAEAVQAATNDSVELAFVDHGYTDEKPATAAQAVWVERLALLALLVALYGPLAARRELRHVLLETRLRLRST
jgi:hypothetical protein